MTTEFPDAVAGLRAGDFSRLEPLFRDPPTPGAHPPIVSWYDRGHFAAHPDALAEALTCVWSAINEALPAHAAIVEELLRAGARAETVAVPTGVAALDELLIRYGRT